MSRDAINNDFRCPYYRLAFQGFAQRFGQCNGGSIEWMDNADDVVRLKLRKRKAQGSAGPLSRVSAPPVVTPQRPSDLQFRPTFGSITTNSADHCSCFLEFHSPEPKPSKGPMTDYHRHMPPGILPRQW